MNYKLILLLALLLPYFHFSQEKIKVITENGQKTNYISIIKKSDITYISLINLADVLNIDYSFNPASQKIDLGSGKNQLIITTRNPFIIIKRDNSIHDSILQMPGSTFITDRQIYIPMISAIKLFKSAFNWQILFNVTQNNLVAEYPDSEVKKGSSELFPFNTPLYDVYGISIHENDGNLVLRFKSNKKISASIKRFDGSTLIVSFRNASIDTSFIEGRTKIKEVSKFIARKKGGDTELKIDFVNTFKGCEIIKAPGNNDLLIKLDLYTQEKWYTKESENFRIIYRTSNDYISDYILQSAEKSLKILASLFKYEPTEKIVIATFDIHDYGFGAATTVPQNFIRLEIEPFEPGYENVPLNERFQWVLNHEIVHIAVNDHSSSIENFFRALFSKVAPEKPQPITILASLLTNSNRYSPRWYQESIAVFLETWLSGGYGRTLGNFDEMYFRSLVDENRLFGGYIEIEADLVKKNFLLETLYYLYGGRFATYLYIKYGYEKLFNWFTSENTDFYPNFKSKFEDIFERDFSDEWDNFIEYEKEFQTENIRKLKSVEVTPKRIILNKSFGWVSQPYFDRQNNSMIFGFHRPSNLATLEMLNLSSGEQIELASLPTPSLISVASTAYDADNGLFFFTTNNNELFRDIYVLDVRSGEKKLLLEDCRVGHLTLNEKTRDLWGIQHSGGKAMLVYCPYPYNSIEQLIGFDIGDEIHHLAVDRSGSLMTAVFHKSNGQQSIIVFDCEKLKLGESFDYEILTDVGSPESPSWSRDGNFIYWSAYTNGVSNIYRHSLFENKTEAVSNTIKGYFKPVEITRDSIFVFEYSSNGFFPLVIPNTTAERLPAIQYLGQRVIDTDPKVLDLIINTSEKELTPISEAHEYNGFNHLDINTFIPVISGFLSQKVLGFYTHIADPIINHDFTMELGVSPFKEHGNDVRFHLKAKYDYKKKYELGINYNAPDFYDLVNQRKRGMLGTRFLAAHNHYWIYDNPLKIKQRTEISLFTGVEYFIDNRVRVSEPDFIVAQTSLNSKNVRRSVGSIDSEEGSEFNLALLFFASDPKSPKYSGQIYAEWDYFTTWLAEHNVFHLKLASGYHRPNEQLFQAKYFFGGFGNRELENLTVRQYRNLLRFPGFPIYGIFADNFGQVLLENTFPPVYIGDIAVMSHFLENINASVFSKGLIINLRSPARFISVGGQVNFVFKHWFNLESTFSTGVAKAWNKAGNSEEWFFSFKLLKN